MITISKDHKNLIAEICKLPKPKAPIEILRNVLLEAKNGVLTLKATDTTVELTQSIPVESESDFITTVGAQKFSQAINACGSDIKLIASDSDLTIKSGRRKFTLPTFNDEAYPAYPEKEEMTQLNVDSGVFSASVNSVAFARGQNDIRYMLNGVNVSSRYQATDSFRLAWLDSGLDCNIILPNECLPHLPKRAGGTVAYNDNILCIAFDDFEMKTKLIDAKYPEIGNLIGSHDKYIQLDRNAFIGSVKAAMITANEKSRNIVIEFNGESSTIKGSNANEKSVIEFDCDCSEPFEVAFNSSYLLDALNALQSDLAIIEYKDEQSQVFIKDDSFQSLLMPVKF